MLNQRFFLTITNSAGQTQLYNLDQNKSIISIGQMAENDIVLADETTPPLLALLDFRRMPRQMIILAGSVEAQLNGQPVVPKTPILLNRWDTLDIAGYQLILGHYLTEHDVVQADGDMNWPASPATTTQSSSDPESDYGFMVSQPTPKRQTCSWFKPTGQLSLSVTNLSARPTAFHLHGQDNRDKCSLEFQVPGETVSTARQTEFSLAPGQTAQVAVRIIPPDRPILGLSKATHFCTFTTTIKDQVEPARSAPTRSVLARIDQAPLIGPGLLVLFSLLLVTLLGPLTARFTRPEPSQAPIAQQSAPTPAGFTRFVSLRANQTPPPPPPAVAAAVPQPESILPDEMTYEEIFRQVAEVYGLAWPMLAEQAYRESLIDPLAVGQAGEMGLMQIMPATWDEWAPKVGVTDPWDPYSNILVGAAYLDHLGRYFTDLGYPEETWMLAAYNWGPHNLRNHLDNGGTWGDGIPSSTRHYADHISAISAAGGVRIEVYERMRVIVVVDQEVLQLVEQGE